MRRIIPLAFTAAFLLAACGDDPTPEQSPDGTWLTRIDGEPAGAMCPHAGQVRRSGPDTNGNGQLEDSEVVSTEWDCFPAPPPSLVRQDVEPPGAHCSAGGTAVHTGLDLDGDGVLADAEVTATSYLCQESDVWEGDFTDADWADPAHVARLVAARVVTGSLTIARPAPVSLPMLELVGGNVLVTGNLTTLELPALRSVGLALSLQAPHLHDLELPALERVGDYLDVGVNDAQAGTFRCPALRDVNGALWLGWGPKGRVELPVLTHVAALTIAGQMSGLVLDALETIDGNFYYDDRALATIELPALRTLGGKLSASGDRQLTRITLPHLEHLGALELSQLPALTTLALPALRQVDLDVGFNDLTALTTVDLSSLAEVQGRLLVSNALALHALALPALSTLHPAPFADTSLDASLFLYQVGIEELSLPSLRHTGGALLARMCPSLRAVRLDALVSAHALDFPDNAVQASLSAPVLEELDRLYVMGTPQLTTLAFPLLARVHDFMDVRDVAITDLASFPRLRDVGTIYLSNLQQLRDLGGTLLDSVGSIIMSSCPALASLHGLEKVHELDGSLSIEGTPSLASLAGLDNVVNVGSRVFIGGSASLTGLGGLARLRTIGAGGLTLSNLPAVTTVAGLAALVHVAGPLQLGGLTGVPADELQAFATRVAH